MVISVGSTSRALSSPRSTQSFLVAWNKSWSIFFELILVSGAKNFRSQLCKCALMIEPVIQSNIYLQMNLGLICTHKFITDIKKLIHLQVFFFCVQITWQDPIHGWLTASTCCMNFVPDMIRLKIRTIHIPLATISTQYPINVRILEQFVTCLIYFLALGLVQVLKTRVWQIS